MLQYYKIHITHIIVAGIWAGALVGLNYIEFMFNHSIRGLDLFWVTVQNIVIGSSNAYWLTKTHIKPNEITINPTQPK